MALNKKFFVRHLLIVLVPATVILLDSCGFCPRNSGELCTLSNAPVTKSTVVTNQSVVFESPGTLIVFHGSACAKSQKSGTQVVLKIEQSIALPAYVTNATVLLNGWEVEYLNGDHHVAGLGTLIDTIRIEQNTLKWQAAGVLSDDNFDDAYQWCYHFTIIAWNSANLNLSVDNTDGNCKNFNSGKGNFYSAYNDNTTTALSSFASFIQNPAFAASKIVSILPRGFGFVWDGCEEDHHLLQLAYNLGHPEAFVEAGKSYKKMFKDTTLIASNSPSQVGNGAVSWETSAIFKDDDDRRGYGFGEVTSGLGGADLGVIEPPFSILPFKGEGDGGTASSPNVRMETFVVTGIPYNYAIPVLTGWDLSYLIGDQHVKKAGVWIDKIQYTKNPADLTGTLTYTLASVLQDDDNWPDFVTRHKVTILGFQTTTGRAESQKIPDLIPFSPSGTSPTAFCRINSDRRLRITIRNQGNSQAGISKTTVIFGSNKPVTLDTPAIPAGGSVDLLFIVPANCFVPDCSFKITVDATNQVNELNHENNNSVNGGCLG